MEMPPDTLEDVGINELFVVVGVDASCTAEQTVSDSSGTHQVISSNSNTESISKLSLNSGAVSLIVLNRGSRIAPIHRILRTLSSIFSILHCWYHRRLGLLHLTPLGFVA
jgi:hypothetical protein